MEGSYTPLVNEPTYWCPSTRYYLDKGECPFAHATPRGLTRVPLCVLEIEHHRRSQQQHPHNEAAANNSTPTTNVPNIQCRLKLT